MLAKWQHEQQQQLQQPRRWCNTVAGDAKSTRRRQVPGDTQHAASRHGGERGGASRGKSVPVVRWGRDRDDALGRHLGRRSSAGAQPRTVAETSSQRVAAPEPRPGFAPPPDAASAMLAEWQHEMQQPRRRRATQRRGKGTGDVPVARSRVEGIRRLRPDAVALDPPAGPGLRRVGGPGTSPVRAPVPQQRRDLPQLDPAELASKPPAAPWGALAPPGRRPPGRSQGRRGRLGVSVLETRASNPWLPPAGGGVAVHVQLLQGATSWVLAKPSTTKFPGGWEESPRGSKPCKNDVKFV